MAYFISEQICWMERRCDSAERACSKEVMESSLYLSTVVSANLVSGWLRWPWWSLSWFNSRMSRVGAWQSFSTQKYINLIIEMKWLVLGVLLMAVSCELVRFESEKEIKKFKEDVFVYY